MISKNVVGLLLICLTSVFFNIRVFAHEEELFFPVEIQNGKELSVIECVALAFKNSPKIRQKKYELDIASSNVGIARSQYFPTFNAGAGFYNENNSNNRDYLNHYRNFPNVGISLNQLVWNFGKSTAYIKIEEFYKIAAEYEFMDSLCSTLFEVKEKYYQYLKAQALVKIQDKNVELNKTIQEISKNTPDLYTAKVNLNKSKIELIEAQNALKNAKVDLTNSMYLDNPPDYKIKSTPTFSYMNVHENVFTPEEFPFKREKAKEIAYASSPDLRALEAVENAMEQSLLFIKRTYYPELTSNVGYGFNKTNVETSNNSLQVGVNLSSSVNLMELKHSIKGADAQVNLAQNEIVLFKKELAYEIQRAFNNVDKTVESIKISEQNLVEAKNNLDLTIEKYKSKEVDYIALQNAKDEYISSQIQHANNLYDYNIALIQVEHAMHYHIVDIHHRSEHAMTYHSDDLIKHLNEVLGCDQKETGRKLKLKKVKDSL